MFVCVFVFVCVYLCVFACVCVCKDVTLQGYSDYFMYLFLHGV